jgi:hypothetical protein
MAAANNSPTPKMIYNSGLSTPILNSKKMNLNVNNLAKRLTPLSNRKYNKLEGFITTDPENSSIEIHKKRLTKSMVRSDYQNKIENGRSYIVGIEKNVPLIHRFYTKDYERVNDPTKAYTEIQNPINRGNYGSINSHGSQVILHVVSSSKKGGKRPSKKKRATHRSRRTLKK